MTNILLCCGGGFSSSAIAVRMQKELSESCLNDKYHIEFSPFSLLTSKKKTIDIDKYDVIICCPHLKIAVQQLLKDFPNFDKPLYLLPPKMYGNMQLKEILIDVDDVISMYNQHHQNPVIFPNEDNLLRITRSVAYRHILK